MSGPKLIGRYVCLTLPSHAANQANEGSEAASRVWISIAQTQPPRFPEAVPIAGRRIDRGAPFIAATPEHCVDFLLQHPLQELLHALSGEGFQRLPGRAVADT